MLKCLTLGYKMRLKRVFSNDFYYHLITRGNNQEIFLHKWDFERLVSYLEKFSKKYFMKVVAFALMPNHIHLLAQQTSDTSISKFMQVLTTAYANYFNKKHSRTGHLFESRFRHEIVGGEEYFLHLSRYIHLNPSSAGLVKKPEDYPWSSYRCYLGMEKIDFIDKAPILSHFSRKDPIKDYKEFVESRIDYQKELSFQKTFLEY